MIVNVECDTKRLAGAVMMEAWKYGVEVEQLHGLQLELTSADEERIERIIKRFPSVKVLHSELFKTVGGPYDE
jgi:hypothetical protein